MVPQKDLEFLVGGLFPRPDIDYLFEVEVPSPVTVRMSPRPRVVTDNDLFPSN